MLRSWWFRDVLVDTALGLLGFAIANRGFSWWFLVACPVFGLFFGTLRAQIHNEWHPLKGGRDD